MIETEPKRRGTVVRDSEGDLWKRGNTRWTCLTPIGARAEVTSVGRLPWRELVNMYGPLELTGFVL